ncbi:MAG: bifunctional UDP-3-O-[3-hydroxymyristoyl] N-acetylglucosamine deacetylase/3-hydroxyacyl-ACP dehydratase [Opitutales bacterium]|nr:bifunctional UDP-3-O-[3-hydroxymyristoyl] N-acetylglucosamine deacetylase/3-hydroxyacyl-ACP dehydratase [Opitutales bacterium]
MKQRTLSREISISGKGLHSGADVVLTLRPAKEDSGIVYRRVDVAGTPEFRPVADMLGTSVRNTTISQGHFQLHTIEHINSALNGMGVDNCIVEMNASEPPILDGSAAPFVAMIKEAGIVEQEKERVYYAVREPVSVVDGERSIIALPYDGFKITLTSTDDRGKHTQNLTIEINPENYEKLLCNARTFADFDDIENLRKAGLIKGGSLDCAIIIKGNDVIANGGLRYPDEFVRHKIMDLVGDIVLVGAPIKAHLIAVRTGHALNGKLSQAIRAQMLTPQKKKGAVPADATALNIKQILDLMPHRYPFVMVDRVLSIDHGAKSIVALKNVTNDEPFFTGHFPGNPVMPGVLQVEAMAQVAGLMLLALANEPGEHITLFMSADKVKFRRVVTPGDQLVIEAKIIKNRGNKIFTAEACCKVNDEVVSSADIMFSVSLSKAANL